MRQELVKRGMPSPVPSFGVVDVVLHAVLRRWRWELAHDMPLRDVPDGRVIVHLRTHCLAVIDHVIHDRSEEHTSELQSLRHLVCRLLLEKKKKITQSTSPQ